jgi:hypothetical protein
MTEQYFIDYTYSEPDCDKLDHINLTVWLKTPRKDIMLHVCQMR